MADKGDIGWYVGRRSIIWSSSPAQARAGASAASITGATPGALLRVFHAGGACIDSAWANGSGNATVYDLADGTYYAHDPMRAKAWKIVMASGSATVTKVSPGTIGFGG